jgi:hypothetical protein
MRTTKSRITLTAILSVSILLVVIKPVFANGPIGWGIESMLAPVKLFRLTHGIAAAGIVIIEALIYWRYIQCSIWKAFGVTIILNLISTFAGVSMIGCYSSSCSFLPLWLGFPIITLSLLGKYKPPSWFAVLPVAAFLIGAILPGMINADALKLNPIALFFVINSPLVLGFGMSVLVEAIGAASMFNHQNVWKAILVGHLFSYLLLMILYPVFGPNPSQLNYYSYGIMYHVKSAEEMKEYLELRHTGNLRLLNISNSDKYRWSLHERNLKTEFAILERSVERPWMNPEVALAVIDFALENYDSLVKDKSIEEIELEKKQLEWFKAHFKHKLAVVTAIGNEDQIGLNNAYDEWVEWDQANKYPVNPSISYRDIHWDSNKATPQDYINRNIPEESKLISPEEFKEISARKAIYSNEDSTRN